MILKISWRREDVIAQGNGFVLVKVHYYAQYANAAILITTEGDTKEDFDNKDAAHSKDVLIGPLGGISVTG